ncbi:MAG: hypothetical protein WCF77_04865 [Minisyncoccia bacterium]|jgi:hypothetical protein
MIYIIGYLLVLFLLTLWCRLIKKRQAQNIVPAEFREKRIFSFQDDFGIFIAATFFGFDTFFLLLWLIFLSTGPGVGLAGLGILFLAMIMAAASIPIYFIVLTMLQRSMRSKKWDRYLLYPFIALNILAVAWVAHLILANK